MPSTFYVTGPDGVVRPSPDFQWGQAMPVEALPGGKFRMLDVASGPCAATGNLFAPNTDILLYASAPGIRVRVRRLDRVRQREADEAEPDAPDHQFHRDRAHDRRRVHRHLRTRSRSARGSASKVTRPGAPGPADADNSFIKGTAIQVRADYQIGDRTVQKFSSGVVGDQIYEDPMTLDLIGFAYVDGDKNVAGAVPGPHRSGKHRDPQRPQVRRRRHGDHRCRSSSAWCSRRPGSSSAWSARWRAS